MRSPIEVVETVGDVRYACKQAQWFRWRLRNSMRRMISVGATDNLDKSVSEAIGF